MATNFSDIADSLWNAADKLRANTPLRASEYSVPVLGLIFLKFADQKFIVVDRILQERVSQSGGRLILGPARYHAGGAIYLDALARYSYLRTLSTGIDTALNNAMKLIERDNPDSLAGALPTNGYNMLDNSTLKALLATFDGIPLDIEGDLFGKIEEWFVKFRFPGYEQVKMVESELGMIPEGWEVTAIGNVAQVLGGGTPSTKVPEYWNDGDIIWFSPTDLTSSGTMFITDSAKKITSSGLKESSARLFPAYSVMMTSRATIGVIAINTKTACTNQGFIICIPNERLSVYQIYHWLEQNRQKIISLASGATFKEINRATFKKLQVVIPSENISKLFDTLVFPIYKHVENLIQRNSILRRTRDLLLPKLISGEIDVSSWAEGDVEEVAQELAVVGTMDAYSSGTGAIRKVAEAGPIEPIDGSTLERPSLWE